MNTAARLIDKLPNSIKVNSLAQTIFIAKVMPLFNSCENNTELNIFAWLDVIH